jgi:rare lipoprotein A (peptidoglycan hydrolase)
MNNNHILRLLVGALLTSLTSCGSLLPPKKEAKKPATPPLKKEVKVAKKEQTVLKTYHGIASWYSIKTNSGRTTASGRRLANGA